MTRLLLVAGAAALLGATGAHGQSAPTGTTGATGATTPPDPGAPPPRVRSTIILRPAAPPRAPEAASAPASAPRADLPTDAAPGQCFARVALPRRMETWQDRVTVRPESTETRTVPAVYADVEERVLVTPERVVRTRVPATWRTVTETVVVRPARTRIETIAPEYRLVTEQVMVSPPRLEWVPEPPYAGSRPADARPLRISPQGEVWRLTEIPAVHRTVTRQVEVSPARRAAFTDPPVTKQVTRRVIDQPARVDVRTVDAVYRTVTKRKLVTPERKETVVIPAEWRTVEKTRPAGPQVLEWREAPCARAVTPALILRVQRALAERGHPVGEPDGVWGARTRAGLDAFQREQGLPSGALTLETLRALNVDA